MYAKSSIAELPLSFSPHLAASLGLQNCLTLTVLQEAEHYAQTQQASIRAEQLEARLPFLNKRELSQCLQELQAQNLIRLCSRITERDNLPQLIKFTLLTPPTTKPNTSGSTSNWTPSADTIFRLTMNGISEAFALSQLDGFSLKLAENPHIKQHAQSQFFTYVQSRHVQQTHNTNVPADSTSHPVFQKASSNNKSTMHTNWQPKELTWEILQDNSKVDRQFIQDCIPEFILYWQDRGDASNTWDSKFVSHVRRQWDLVQSNEANARSPKPIHQDWQPSIACYDCLEFAYISREFAQDLVPEFVLYWRNDGKAFTSWDNKFLQYAKQRWHYLNAAQQGHTNGQQSSRSGYATAEASLERLKDTSWAH